MSSIVAQKQADPMPTMSKEEIETEEETVVSEEEATVEEVVAEEETVEKKLTSKMMLMHSSVVRNFPKNSERKQKLSLKFCSQI